MTQNFSFSFQESNVYSGLVPFRPRLKILGFPKGACRFKSGPGHHHSRFQLLTLNSKTHRFSTKVVQKRPFEVRPTHYETNRFIQSSHTDTFKFTTRLDASGEGHLMARTNIEEEAHRRVNKLAQLLNISDREALGTVAYLWTESQDILKTEGTLDEVIEWCHLFGADENEIEKWISALEKSRIISSLDNGHFKIHGNETQIEGRVSRIKRAAKGGQSLKKKWAEAKKLKAGSKKASSLLQAGSKQAKPRQDKTGQDNAIQGKAKQSKGVAISDSGESEPDLNSLVWQSYSEAYENRYHTNPVRNAKVNGQIKSLVKRLGKEAPEVVKFYVEHNKTFYVNKLHEIGLCLSDAESLRTQWFHGKAITQADVRQFEKASENQRLMDMIDRGEI